MIPIGLPTRFCNYSFYCAEQFRWFNTTMEIAITIVCTVPPGMAALVGGDSLPGIKSRSTQVLAAAYATAHRNTSTGFMLGWFCAG